MIERWSPSIIGPDRELLETGELVSPYQYEVGCPACEIYVLVSEPSYLNSRRLEVDLMYEKSDPDNVTLAHFIDFVIDSELGFAKPEHLQVD